MRVVIVGAGEVGYHVIGSLYREGVDIQVVDTDPGVLEQLKSEFNVATLLGNATNSKLLEEAGVDRADLFIAITNYDETNIISCMLAGNLSRAKKIARVKSMDIGRSFSEAIHFGIDLIINPYEVSAEFLEKLIDYPIVTDINQFLDEKVLLVRIPIEEGNPLVDCSVMDFGQKSRLTNTLIALVQREGESFMPRAETMIRLDDQVYFFCASDQFNALQKFLGISRRATRRVIINGGGHIGHALAKRLEKRRLDVRILEISEWRCQQLSQWLDKSLILNADGNDPMALKSEGVEHADFFINVTSSDDVNLVSSTLAKGMGVPRTVTLVKQPELIPMISQRKISDVAFSPRQLTARKILRFVRGQQLDSFFTFANSDIELLELKVNPGLPCLDTPMASLALPEGVLIGAVRREGRIFIPRGHDSLQAGDRILLIQQRRNRRLTKALFLEAPGGAQVVPDAAASRNG